MSIRHPQLASESQLTLSPLFAHNRPSVSPVEAARALGISDQQARDLVEAGELRAFPIGDQAGTASRKHMRILRSSVEAFFLERYASQNGEEFPLVNSPEVTAMRVAIRARQSLGTAPALGCLSPRPRGETSTP